jgi:hypothetical protein
MRTRHRGLSCFRVLFFLMIIYTRLPERLFPRRPSGSNDSRGRFEWDNISCFGYPSWVALQAGIPELGTTLSDSIAATRALRGEN